MNFLPSNYEAPSNNNGYMKIQKGENRIRILSAPILGWEDWTNDKKPVRFRLEAKPLAPIHPDRPVRHFWAMIVWDYACNAIKVLQVTQAGVRRSLEELSKNSDWGAPYHYDIKIVREGEEMKTKYTVMPIPHRPVTKDIEIAFHATPINLEALYENKDPFAPGQRSYTQGVFQMSPNMVASNSVANSSTATAISITDAEAKAFSATLKQCSSEYQKGLISSLELMGFLCIEDMTPEAFLRIMPVVKQKAIDNQLANRSETVFNAPAEFEVPF